MMLLSKERVAIFRIQPSKQSLIQSFRPADFLDVVPISPSEVVGVTRALDLERWCFSDEMCQTARDTCSCRVKSNLAADDDVLEGLRLFVEHVAGRLFLFAGASIYAFDLHSLEELYVLIVPTDEALDETRCGDQEILARWDYGLAFLAHQAEGREVAVWPAEPQMGVTSLVKCADTAADPDKEEDGRDARLMNLIAQASEKHVPLVQCSILKPEMLDFKEAARFRPSVGTWLQPRQTLAAIPPSSLAVLSLREPKAKADEIALLLNDGGCTAWCIDHLGLSSEEARNRVLEEFPLKFGHPFWNPDLLCAGPSSEDRARWCVQTCGMTVEAAQKQVMDEFCKLFEDAAQESLARWKSEVDCDGVLSIVLAQQRSEMGMSEDAAKLWATS
eukprot:g29617.t1